MTTNQPFQVLRTGKRRYYIQEVATGDLKALPFDSKKAAQAAVDGWNKRREERR